MEIIHDEYTGSLHLLGWILDVANVGESDDLFVEDIFDVLFIESREVLVCRGCSAPCRWHIDHWNFGIVGLPW